MLDIIQGQTMAALMHAMSVVGADGANTIAKGKKIMYAVIAVIAAIGGLYLVAIAIRDCVSSLKGDNKDWHGFIIGLVVGIIGGVFIAIAVGATWATFFSNMGQDFNVVN